jgi:hypothetical protein
MTRRTFLLITLTVALAVALTFYQIPVVSSQGVTLVAARVREDLPIKDLDAALWQKATALDVPLSAQQTAPPILPKTNIKSAKVRALHNTEQIAFLVEWDDPTKNDEMIRVQDFRDAFALQFPVVEGGQPFICMGQQVGNVNIWHWKADWQADIAKRQDMETLYPNMNVDYYPFAAVALPAPKDYKETQYVPAFASDNLFAMEHQSPVEDLVAGGFGSLTAQGEGGQNVQGHGSWTNGKWRVIFSRALASNEKDDAQLIAGKVYQIAFAAWDGANGERNGQKSTSQWISLQVEMPIANPPAQPTFVSLLLVVGVLVLVVVLFSRMTGKHSEQ